MEYRRVKFETDYSDLKKDTKKDITILKNSIKEVENE